MAALIEELIAFLAEDAEVLGTLNELALLHQLAGTGTSSDRQRVVHAQAAAAGDNPGQAVVRHLIEEFRSDL